MSRIRRIINLAATVCITTFATSQTVPHVNQTATRSSCVNIVLLSGARVNCSNLTPGQKQALAKIPSILKAALENQGYLEAIMAKLQEMSQVGQQTTTNFAPSGIANSGTIQGNATVNNGPPPMAMTDVDSARYSAAAQKIPMKKKFIVLLSTNDESSFDLAKQLCSDAKSLSWTYACPRSTGRNLSMDGFSHMVINNAANLPIEACMLLNGDKLPYSDEFSHNATFDGPVARGCMIGIDAEGGAKIPGPPDTVPEKGLTCYSDNWNDPDSAAFKTALNEGGLKCTFVSHPFHMRGIQLLVPMGNTNLGEITVVIGRPAQP